MLVELEDEISDTVADLFNKSLISGEVSPDWKLANAENLGRFLVRSVQARGMTLN